MLTPPPWLPDQAWIAAHIPHAGSMCLLEGVVEWDAGHVACRADNHRRLDHPLRQFGRLGAACGIEYAAQAMAVHGALLSQRGPAARPGMLVSARQVTLHVGRLDDVQAALRIRAERLGDGDPLLLYAFSVSAGGRTLLEGRACVLLGSLPEALEPSAP